MNFRSAAVAWCFTACVLLASSGYIAWTRFVAPPTVDRVLRQVAATDPALQPKICAHRCNNIPMYRLAHEHFDCIEIDVHVSPAAGGPPGVYHEPDSSYQGLTLEFLLSHELLPRGRLWLDTKDLSLGNWAGYLALLDRLIPAARRKDVVVETGWSTPEIEPVVAAFRARGYAVSWYLPEDPAIRCGSGDTPACATFRRAVLENAARGFSHLSFDARAWPFVKQIRSQLPASVRLLTWDLSRRWPDNDLLAASDIYIINLPSRHLN